MTRNIVFVTASLFLAGTALAEEQGESVINQVSLTIGPAFASSGDSPISGQSLPGSDQGIEGTTDFSEDFDTGFSWNLAATGPIHEWFGWRAELGRESMSADADRAAGRIDGTYKLFRFQVGLHVTNFESTGKGRPYGFFTIGLAHQDASIKSEVEEGTLELELDGTSNFGLSFGGGYEYRFGEQWGVAGDLHVNVGVFADSTRMWWTPGAQVFYRF